MKVKEKFTESSQIYADFTISRIDPVVRESLSDEQLKAIRNALLANQPFKKHALDIRGSIPLYFAKYYFVLLAGRDKRRRTQQKEMQRHNRGNLSIGYMLTLLMISFLVAVIWVAAFAGFYWTKNEMGIDFFANFHLMELFKGSR